MGMPVITASTTTRDQAITDLIQSVALEETALSHILNAEGEKIQKMVALPRRDPGGAAVHQQVCGVHGQCGIPAGNDPPVQTLHLQQLPVSH